MNRGRTRGNSGPPRPVLLVRERILVFFWRWGGEISFAPHPLRASQCEGNQGKLLGQRRDGNAVRVDKGGAAALDYGWSVGHFGDRPFELSGKSDSSQNQLLAFSSNGQPIETSHLDHSNERAPKELRHEPQRTRWMSTGRTHWRWFHRTFGLGRPSPREAFPLALEILDASKSCRRNLHGRLPEPIREIACIRACLRFLSPWRVPRICLICPVHCAECPYPPNPSGRGKSRRY